MKRSGYRMRVAVARALTLSGWMALVARSALAAPDDESLSAFDRLQARYPGARLARGDEEVAVYGRPMTAAATALKAAGAWWLEHGAALGLAAGDARSHAERPVGTGRLTVLEYQQYIDGLPVEDGIARVAVLNAARPRVVYAAGRIARRSPIGFPIDRVTPDAALRSVRGRDDVANLLHWTTPTQVIFVPGEFTHTDPVRAWKFQASAPVGADFAAYTFFVSAADGELLHVRDEVYRLDIVGHVNGKATPGTRPDVAGNPPVAFNLAELEVRSAIGDAALSDAAGNFLLADQGTAPLRVEADLSGPWVVVHGTGATSLHLEQTVTPPGPVEFLFNPTPAEASTAQVNAFRHTNLTHDFYKSRQPAFTGLDLPLDCFVNLPGTCNAYFTPVGLSINFFASGAGCVNTAYSSVIAHEFGHFILDRHRLPQGAFGEGYGDCVSILQLNDPVVGREFAGPGTFVRDVFSADKQYPCFGEIHDCGQILGGVWWDLKLNLDVTLGPAAGLAYAQQLFTDWTEITVGGRLRNSAHPLTAVEVLTVDDNDGDISNGTPHGDEICAAFASHNIPCPGPCDDVSRLTATCRAGAFAVRATLVTDYPEGTEVTLTLDGGDARTATVSRFGRATTRWTGVSEGTHLVCVPDCPGVCRSVTCTP